MNNAYLTQAVLPYIDVLTDDMDYIVADRRPNFANSADTYLGAHLWDNSIETTMPNGDEVFAKFYNSAYNTNVVIDNIDEAVGAVLDMTEVERTRKHIKGDMGSFKYEYILNRLETKDIEGVAADNTDKLVIGKYEYDGSTFLLLGADSDVKYLNLTTTDGNRANLDKGYYISNVMAYSYGIKAGDDFTFVNPTTMEEKTVKIEGIISNNTQKLLISNMDDARELLGWQKDTYNGLLSDRALQLGDEISKTVTSDDIKEQMNTVLDEMGAIIYSLAVIGAIICIAALYVSVNMLVSENRHNISMLKVLGLKDREINRMVLDVNHMIIPIGIVTGIGAGYGIMDVVFKVYSGMEGVLYETYVTIKSIVLTVVIVVLCYVVSLLMVRRKADRVDMVESLKDNRE